MARAGMIAARAAAFDPGAFLPNLPNQTAEATSRDFQATYRRHRL